MKCLAAMLAISLALMPLEATQAAQITLDVHDVSLADVLALLSAESGVNLIADDSVRPDRVTLHLRNVSFDDALSVLVHSHDLQVRHQGSILIVGAAETMNRRYDAGSDPLGAKTAVFSLRHADPEDTAREIGGALPVGTVIVADKRTNSVVVSADGATLRRAQTLVNALDVSGGPSQTTAGPVVYGLRYQRADALEKLLKLAVPAATSIADDDRNALIVTGDQRAQHDVATLLAQADVPSPQVLFEVKVADVQPANDTSDVGLEFGGLDQQGQPLSGALTYAFSRGTLLVNARLNALVSQGRAQVLATPKLLTVNNHEADLLIGETYPIIYQSSSFGGQQVQFVDIGVKLRLTPTIGADGSVVAELHPEYSEIEGFSANDLPIIANRKIDSTLRVQSDQTIVLGGLLRETSSETITKIPGLADIPILGKLFQDRSTQHQRNEVVFLITPHVIFPGKVPPRE
jgi:type IV pilus assembly protein PilQ